MYVEVHLTVLQAHFGDISGVVADHCHKASIATRQVIIFLVAEGPLQFFSFIKTNTC